MATTHVIKHGDTLPILNAVLYQDEALSSPVDLTNSTTVKLKVGTGNDPLLLDKTMTVITPAAGQVRYQFVIADWSAVAPGSHSMEIEVTWNNGDVSTYPKVGYATLQVEADLDPD